MVKFDPGTVSEIFTLDSCYLKRMLETLKNEGYGLDDIKEVRGYRVDYFFDGVHNFRFDAVMNDGKICTIKTNEKKI